MGMMSCMSPHLGTLLEMRHEKPQVEEHCFNYVLVAISIAAIAVFYISTIRTHHSPIHASNLYGPEVLDERLIGPPGTPDWILMDCDHARNSSLKLAKFSNSDLPISDQSICENQRRL